MIGEYRRVRLVYNGQPTWIYKDIPYVNQTSDSNPEGFENEKGQGNSPGKSCEPSISN